ncbi:MAG: phosphatase PAP2 family protein [Burkholderiales bacterium]|nr:phosphatase PAP2 family protein [Burkholderiales bacterium]
MNRRIPLILLALLASASFTAIALDTVYGGPLSDMETAFATAIDYRAYPQLTSLMLVVTHLGGNAFVSVIAAIAILIALQRQRRHRAIFLSIAVYGGLLLNAGLKQLFQRARPLFENPVLVLETYSFPSGHAMAATMLYGSLAVVCIASLRSATARGATVTAAALLILITCMSRVYLGVHHLSDVLGGVTEGVVWLIVCYCIAHFPARRPCGLPMPDRK